MNLLLDLGNTRLKWASLERGTLCNADAMPWVAIEADGLPAAWIELARAADHVRAASVAGAQREQAIVDCLQGQGLAPPVWVRSPAAACGVRNAYREPSALGVDRFLGMVAAHAEGLGPCVVACAGTALTLDALAADGRHLGGLIAPGPRLMQLALRQATAQLPDPGVMPLEDAATDTATAIASGCRHAALGLIERFAARMREALGGEARLVLAGGDAAALAGHLAPAPVVRADLVLEGLAVWDRDPPAA